MENYSRHLPAALQYKNESQIEKPIVLTFSPSNSDIEKQSRHNSSPYPSPQPKDLKKKQTRTQTTRSLSPQRLSSSTEHQDEPENRSRRSKRITPLKVSSGLTRSDSPHKSSHNSSKSQDSPKSPKILSPSGHIKSPKVVATETDFLPLVRAIRDGEIGTIQQFLSHPENINYQDPERQNTPLHLVVISPHKEKEKMAILFLLKPETDTIRTNIDKNAPFQYLMGINTLKENRVLKQDLIERARLDYLVNAMFMTYDELVDTKNLDDIVLTKKIESVLAKIPQTILPCYGDAPFILSMIHARRKSDNWSLLQIIHHIFKTKPQYKDEWHTSSLHHKLYLHDNFFEDPINNPNKPCPDTGNTLLDDMIATCNEPLITLLLANPYINTLTKNKYGFTAVQRMTKDNICNYPTLYKALEQRAMLDRIIKALIVTNKKIVETECEEKTINNKIKTFLRRISQDILPHYADEAFIHKMVKAYRLYNLEALKKICDNYVKDPNYQDPESGYTLTHQLVVLRDKNRLKRLFENPTVQILKDNENKPPQALLYSLENGSDIRKIRTMLFARDSLETRIPQAIAQSVEGFLLTNPTMDLSKIKVSNIDIEDVIEKIKIDEEKIKNKQGDSDLPSEVDMSTHTNDTFLSKAIKARTNDQFLSDALSTTRKQTNPMQYFSLPIEYSDNTLPFPSSPKKEHTSEEEKIMNIIDKFAILQLQNGKESEEMHSSLLEFLTKID